MPGMFELPATISPVAGSMLNNTVHLKPMLCHQPRDRRQRLFGPIFVIACEKDMCLPLPGPAVPSNTRGAALMKSSPARQTP